MTNTTKPDVSVIVPIYNIEQFLPDCLNSLLTQDGVSFELICINDGSTDQSGNIATEFSIKNPQIKIININNSGLSVARNTGMQHACGKYICFIDGDDQLKPNALIDLFTHAELCKLDVAYFNASTIFETPELELKNKNLPQTGERTHSYLGVMLGTDLALNYLDKDEFAPVVTLGFYNLDFLKSIGLYFIPGIIHEDISFSFSVWMNAKRCMHVDQPYYSRLIRNGSIMTSLNKAKSFVGHAISVYQIINHPAITSKNDFELAQRLSKFYSLHCAYLVKDPNAFEGAQKMVHNWPNFQEQLFMQHLLTIVYEANQSYRRGLYAASEELSQPDGLHKRVTVPCAGYIDNVTFEPSANDSQSGYTVTIEGWMLLWDTTAVENIELLIDKEQRLLPLTFTTISRPDVIQHFVRGEVVCGFKATFKVASTFSSVRLMGCLNHNIQSEEMFWSA
jgi:glycosyltransferase involved in cell wall biosynthesis